MTEKSPIDTLSEIHSMLTSLGAKMALMEQNMALLHDKANGALFSNSKPPQQPRVSVAQHGMMQELDRGQKSIGMPQVKPQQDARVHGKIYSPDKKPIQGATVIIKNQKNEVVEQPKTGLGGEWEIRLPAGKYAMTIAKSGMSPIYRFLEVKAGTQELEVL